MRQAWDYFLSDIARYAHVLGRSRWVVLFFAQGAQASLVYRIGHWLYGLQPRLLPLRIVLKIVLVFYFVLFRLTEIVTGISLEPKARIGRGLYIGHFGGIIVGSGVTLGDYCNLSQGVTLGVDGRGERRGSPQVGDRVFIGPGAKVLGHIQIGSDAVIGANAVVVRSLPERAVAGGIPAKVLSYRGSFDFVTYDGMERDEARVRSLALGMQNVPPAGLGVGDADEDQKAEGQ
jgi:serine O-acetyltransferase